MLAQIEIKNTKIIKGIEHLNHTLGLFCARFVRICCEIIEILRIKNPACGLMFYAYKVIVIFFLINFLTVKIYE